jgi:ERCC4-type nuclease
MADAATTAPPDGSTRLVLAVEAGDQKDFRDRKANPYDRIAYLERNVQGWVRVEKRTLYVGDYTISLPDGRLVAIIERKNMPDMLSSITADGRYKSQMKRGELAAGIPEGVLVYWLLVGALPDAERRPDDARCITSAMAHLNTLPHTRVVHVLNSEQATLDWLVPTLRYLDEQQRGIMFPDLPQHEVAMVRGRRPQLDKQPDVWFEQVSVANGIGPKAARAVVARYPTVRTLLTAYETCARSFRKQPPTAPPRPAKGKGSRKRAASPPKLVNVLDAMLKNETHIRGADSKRLREVLLTDAEAAALGADQ